MKPKLTHLALIFVLLAACTPARTEVIRLKNLVVVYTTHEKINEERHRRGGVKEVSGFYDPLTNTIWCEKNDYHTCGHELRHAAGETHGSRNEWLTPKDSSNRTLESPPGFTTAPGSDVLGARGLLLLGKPKKPLMGKL